MNYGRIFLSFIMLFGTVLNSTSVHASESKVYVGMANAYRYNLNSSQIDYSSDISVPIEFPLDFKGTLINWSQKKMAYLPKKFLLSDGTVLRTFTLVDRTPGSAVDQYVQKIRSAMAKMRNKSSPSLLTKAEVLDYLTSRVQDHLAWHSKDGGHKDFPWDKGLDSANSLSARLDNRRSELKSKPNGQWIETQEQHPVIPFSQILDAKRGYCLEMVLLASFILESFSIPHRVVFGSVLTNDSEGGGHCWIELPDGRILDVAWNTLAAPKRNQHSLHSDWLWFGNSIGYQFRYSYQFFPLIQL